MNDFLALSVVTLAIWLSNNPAVLICGGCACIFVLPLTFVIYNLLIAKEGNKD